MSRPILFVDIDGCLNTRPGSLDRDKVDLVLKIQQRTGCLTVLSSDWRLFQLKKAQISNEIQFESETPLLSVLPGEDSAIRRQNEICRWMWRNHARFENIAIIDDMPMPDRLVQGRQILTDPNVGLTPDQAEAAILLLLNWSPAIAPAGPLPQFQRPQAIPEPEDSY